MCPTFCEENLLDTNSFLLIFYGNSFFVHHLIAPHGKKNFRRQVQVLFLYSKIVQSQHCIYWIWCSDWMFFLYEYKIILQSFKLGVCNIAESEDKYRINVVLKVDMDIITSIAASLVVWVVRLSKLTLLYLSVKPCVCCHPDR